MREEKKIYRSREERILFGVSDGIAKYFNIDVTLVRIAFLVLVLINGAGAIAYILLVFAIPEEKGPEDEDSGEDSGNKKSMSQEIKDRVRGISNEMKRPEQGWLGNSRNIFGLVVILVGLTLLAEKFAPLYVNWFQWNILWPTGIVLFGLYLIFKGE